MTTTCHEPGPTPCTTDHYLHTCGKCGGDRRKPLGARDPVHAQHVSTQDGDCGECFPDGPYAEPTDEVLNAVADALTDAPQAPSTVGRRAGVSTRDAHRALCWLAENQMAVPVGNGAWTKYRTRRFGEASSRG